MVLVIILVAIIAYLAIKWSAKNFDFFEKQGLKFQKPYPFIGTNSWIFKGENIVNYLRRTYLSFPNEKLFGLFGFRKPFFVIRDPELLKHLTVKEFEHFPNHMNFIDPKHDELFGNVLSVMRGKKWKEMRSSLSPAFTGSKMRLMFELVSAVGQQMTDFFKNEYTRRGSVPYDIKDLFSCFTNDVIATCAFGLKCDSFSNPKNEFYQIGQQFRSPIQLLKFTLFRLFPGLLKIFKMNFISDTNRKLFNNMIIETMKTREKENIVRPDMINLLIQLKKGELGEKDAHEDDTDSGGIAAVKEIRAENAGTKTAWTDSELIAQCFIFFLAGFETSSSLMTFLAYELATNPEIQEKLLEEIDAAGETLDGKPLTYEVIQSMKYLDMVISESLRKWPPAFLSDRECSKDFNYEDTDGLKFQIKKGEYFWIPIHALHMDPKYFPNPEKFDPERFSEENRKNINFNAYLPFGIGPRNCIGSRFALLEIKVAIYYLLMNFTFEVCSETQIPLKLKKLMGGLFPEKKIKLNLRPRNL